MYYDRPDISMVVVTVVVSSCRNFNVAYKRQVLEPTDGACILCFVIFYIVLSPIFSDGECFLQKSWGKWKNEDCGWYTDVLNSTFHHASPPSDCTLTTAKIKPNRKTLLCYQFYTYFYLLISFPVLNCHSLCVLILIDASNLQLTVVKKNTIM